MKAALVWFLIALSGCLAAQGASSPVDGNVWVRRLEAFPSMPSTAQASVLKDLPELLSQYHKVKDSVDSSGLDTRSALVQQTRAASGKPSLTLVSDRLKKLQALPEEAAKREGEPTSWLMAMAANALDLGLASSDTGIRAAAEDTLQALFPETFEPDFPVQSGCGTGWQYARHAFYNNLNQIIRVFAKTRWKWFEERRHTSESFDYGFQLLAAERREPAFKTELVAMLKSKDEATLRFGLACLIQWPDDQFLPQLESILLRESSESVVGTDEFQFAVRRFGVKAVRTIRNAWDQVDDRDRERFVQCLYLLPCQETWDFFMECLRSPNAKSRAVAIHCLWYLPDTEWETNYSPQPADLPKDFKSRIERLTRNALKDTSGLVRFFAASHFEDLQMPDSFWRGIAQDPLPEARERVCDAFDRMSASLGWELLFKLAQDPARRVRESAFYNASDVEGVADLARAKKASRVPSERTAIVRILGEVLEPEAIAEVAAFLKDQMPSVRAAAVQALSEFDEGMPHILSVAGDPSEVVVKEVVDAVAIGYSEEALAQLRKLLDLVRTTYRPLVEQSIVKMEKFLGDPD